MDITQDRDAAPWLLLIFTLPSKKSSERVGIWRKLQKYGTLPLRNSGYVLPSNPTNQERLEWLAASIRGCRGEASVLQVRSIDDLPNEVLKQRFRDERKPDYTAFIREVKGLKRSDPAFSKQLARLKRHLSEIIEIDFFQSPLRGKAQEVFLQAERPVTRPARPDNGRVVKADYQNRLWITRPRPGIDRTASGWLIKRFIDPKAVFIFDTDSGAHPDAVPFDMYRSGGFGHEGENCTFETLVGRFAIRDKKVGLIAKTIHDADIEDDKYGRNEGLVINQVLNGWASQGISDEELMRRGMDVMEGLYRSIS